MRRLTFLPAPALRPYVDSYALLTGNLPVPEKITLLPDGGIHLVLNMGEPIQSLTGTTPIVHEGVFLVGEVAPVSG